MVNFCIPQNTEKNIQLPIFSVYSPGQLLDVFSKENIGSHPEIVLVLILCKLNKYCMKNPNTSK